MLVCCCFERNLDGLGFRMKKDPVIFGPNFWTPATVRAAAIRQEIAPQTISTKDVYQSKHIVAAQIGAARAAAACEANIDTTYYTTINSVDHHY